MSRFFHRDEPRTRQAANRTPADADPADLQQRERIQDMDQRLVFADRAFVLTALWLGFLFVFVVAQVVLNAFGRALSDTQFIAVVATTTASVFGFWMLVGRYLFPQRRG